jgi:hypothetical protein
MFYDVTLMFCPKSKYVACRPCAKIRANVVFPHCLGPSKAVTGERRTALFKNSKYCGREIMPLG